MDMKFLIAAFALAFAACGYHTAGHGDLMPKTIKSVCVPAFKNASSRYKLTDRLPEAITREFIARTRYSIVSDCDTADAVLRGSVLNFLSFQTVVDSASTIGRATAADIHVIMSVTFTERATGKVLYSNLNFDARERYEISVDPIAYFEESDAGLNRVAVQVSRQVVSAILNKF
jgi:outer membrane lipopolysaccharide assembly protein LptE/RlpB